MNCQEFRRKLLIEPGSRSKEFDDHAASCRECAEQARQALRFEEKLHAALNVPSPTALGNRIIAARSDAAEPGRARFDSRWLALAAGLLLAVGLAGWMGYKWEQNFGISSGLGTAVVNHINAELDHLHADADANVGRPTLVLLLSQFGARLEGEIGRVSYASRCPIRRHFGVHMVLPGQEGPVTVLIMPGENLLHRREVRSSRFSGVIVPTAYGSMAVVGEKLEPVEQVVERMQQSIIWGA